MTLYAWHGRNNLKWERVWPPQFRDFFWSRTGQGKGPAWTERWLSKLGLASGHVFTEKSFLIQLFSWQPRIKEERDPALLTTFSYLPSPTVITSHLASCSDLWTSLSSSTCGLLLFCIYKSKSDQVTHLLKTFQWLSSSEQKSKSMRSYMNWHSLIPFSLYLLLFLPLLTLLQPHWYSSCSLNAPRTLLPQGLCPCWSPCQNRWMLLPSPASPRPHCPGPQSSYLPHSLISFLLVSAQMSPWPPPTDSSKIVTHSPTKTKQNKTKPRPHLTSNTALFFFIAYLTHGILYICLYPS